MMLELKRTLLGLLVLLLILVAVLAGNTLMQGSRQPVVATLPAIAFDRSAAAEHLAQAIRLRTVSDQDDARLNAEQFTALHDLLARAYPKVHAAMRREVVGGLSLLYTWPGTDPQARPVLLMAHQDVVPVAPGTENDWEVEPFAGIVRDGFVWGRGAWDDKGNLIAQMEALELLVASGFQPRRTIHLAYGADEEVGGKRGAAQIAALLAARGVRLEFVVDEGLLVIEGLVPGVKPPVALVGTAEKGYLSVALGVSAAGGHSSMPPVDRSSAIGVLGAALTRLDEMPFPARLEGVARETFETLAPETSGLQRVALSNLWLFGPLVRWQLEQTPGTNAQLRTTTALTTVQAGNKDNVLPGRATATVNLRLLPGETRDSALAQVKRSIGDARIELSALPGNEASKLSASDSASYKLVQRTIREVFTGAVVAPGLMLGGTDTKHFEPISDNIYRFTPLRVGPADLARLHGSNERISVNGLGDAVRFYHRLLVQAAGDAQS